MNWSRRSILRQMLTLGGVSLAGCASDIHYPEELPGQPDIVLNNCRTESQTIHLTVSRDRTNQVLHDTNHTVPADFCSDMGASYQIEKVWSAAGEYRIQATAETVGTDAAVTTVSELGFEEDTATVSVLVDDQGIDILK